MNIIAYVNQPIVKHGSNFYTSHKNFIDFMCYWASRTENFSLIVPLKTVNKINKTNSFTKLSVDSKKVIAATPYKSHIGAIFAAIANQYNVLKTVKRAFKSPQSSETILVLPGPSMMLTLLSFQLPKNLNVVIFVRGNSLKTISFMYEGKILKPFAVGLSTFFKKRLNKMQQKGATTFVFGSELRLEYSKYGPTHNISPLIENNSLIQKGLTPPTHSPIKILFIGRLSNEKGILELIEASKLLINRKVNFELTIAGHGPLEKTIAQSLLSEEINQVVSFVGRLSPGKEVLAYIDNAHLLVVPSKTEGIPRVIAESLSRDTHVLATDVGGIKDAFGDAIDYFVGNSPSQIADAIQHITSNPQQLKLKSKLRHETATSCTFETNLTKIKSEITRKYNQIN